MNLQDQFSNFFSNRVVELLASAVGLNPAQTQSALRAILPRQLDNLADLAGNPQTSATLGDLWAGNDLPQNPELALSSPEEVSRLETLGQSLSSRLFGGTGNWLGDAAQHADGNQSAVSRLSHLALPLLMSFLGRSGVSPQNAVSQLSGMRGALSAMLPAAAAAGAVPATGEIIDSVAARPEVEVREGAPVAAAVPAPEPERHLAAAPVPAERSGCNPLWLLPLLLLAGLAWYLSQNRETPIPAPVTSSATTSTTTTTSAVTTDEGIVVGNVQDGAELPLEPFVLSGTAPADDVISITNQNGELLATETADASGAWEIQMPAPLAGENIYTISGTPSEANSTFTLLGTAAEASAAAATPAAASAPTASTATASPAATDTAVVPVTITEPAEGAAVAAESFTIAGQGQPNASYALYEDGVNVGTFFADESGVWSADITAAEPGDRSYVVVDEAGNQVAVLPLTVNEPVAVSDCSVNDVLSLSLADGDTVSAPFRFGGTGSAESYTVRVYRGQDQIGEKVIDNGDNCSWSYLSQPGGQGGNVGEITYQVVPDGAADPEATITLNVIQSGVNFENGEYVGPTTEPATVQ